MRINNQIKLPFVRLILDGKQIGIVKTEDAIRLASERGEDLVEVDPQNKPPVCRVMDYGKFLYEQKKRKSKQKPLERKEIRLSPVIAEHDVETKIGHIRKFLEKGLPVRVNVEYKKRQIVHPESGKKILENVIKALEDISKVESRPKFEGKNLFVNLVPNANLH
jgi:translation initiation factor IF-3